MRSDETLKDLVNDVKGWCNSDLGLTYKVGMFEAAIDKMVQVRIGEFLKRRIGHLPDADLIGFRRALLETDNKPAPGREPGTVIETINGKEAEARPQLGIKTSVEKDSRKGKKG
tara:strand:+ start:502 stop:843 length:342 start_codon:yes stop_codon:yes gene_type:complete